MQTYSFTTEDAAQQTETKLHALTFFDPKYDPLCKMNTNGIQESFNKDINRSPNLHIETEHGITDLTQEIKLKYGDDHMIHYGNVYDILTDKYKLSQNQAEYIIAASYQGSIAGGLTGFGTLLVDYITDPIKYMNRNGNMSKIVIDKNNNLSYVGGQKMTFDCDRTTYNDIIRDTIHTNFQSQDYVAANITAQLGQLGVSKFRPSVVISVVGNGIAGTKIIEEFKKIETKIIPLAAEEVLQQYHDFSNSIMDVNGQNKLYQQAVRTKIGEILATDPLQIDTEVIEDLKKLTFTREALAEIVVTHIDNQLSIFKDKDMNITNDESKNIVNDIAAMLAKFTDFPKGYIERFSKDIVKQRTQSAKSKSVRKNIITTTCRSQDLILQTL